MTRDMKKLLRELDLPEGCPTADAKAVKRRVNAALNTDPSERKAYMRQKIKLAAVLVAAVVALTGTALAVATNIDVLQAFFEGDMSSAQAYVQTPNTSITDGRFKVTLESAVTDGEYALSVITVQALTQDAKAELNSDDFINMDTFYSRAYDAAGERIYGPGGGGAGELKERRAEDSRTYCLNTNLTQGTVRFCHIFGFLPKGMELEVPMNHPAQSLRMEANFQSVTPDKKPYTFTGVTVTPLSFKLRYYNSEAGVLEIPYFFRMTDGSIQTMNQLLDPSSSSGGQNFSGGDGDMEHRRLFRSPLDLSTLDAIIVDGKAFPLRGGKPEDVTVDPKLSPSTLPLMGEMEGNGPYGISVRALCDTLGATCVWDNTARSATLTYRGVTIVFTLGSKESLINGENIALHIAPEAENGKLKIAMSDALCDAWGIDVGINYDFVTGIAVNWNICP